MNIKSNGQIKNLVNSFEQKTVKKTPQETKIVETGMTGKTFAERKATFDQKSQQPMGKDLASVQMQKEIEVSIDNATPEVISKKAHDLTGLYSKVSTSTPPSAPARPPASTTSSASTPPSAPARPPASTTSSSGKVPRSSDS